MAAGYTRSQNISQRRMFGDGWCEFLQAGCPSCLTTVSVKTLKKVWLF